MSPRPTHRTAANTKPSQKPNKTPSTASGKTRSTVQAEPTIDDIARLYPASHPALSGLRLRPGTPVLQCGPTGVQFGADARWALRCTGLSSSDIAWCQEIGARANASLTSVARRQGLTGQRFAELVHMLHNAGLLTDPRHAGPLALGSLRADAAGHVTALRRAQACVGISSLGSADCLGRLGAMLALTLATAGVGQLVFADSTPVQATDVGYGIYGVDDVGKQRDSVLRQAIARCAPQTHVSAEARVDLLVTVEHHGMLMPQYSSLMGRAIPHLPVIMQQASMTVGPLVLPGTTACTTCHMLHKADADAAWPGIHQQLLALPALPQDAALAASTACVVAANVLCHIDQLMPTAVNHTIDLALPTLLPHITALPAHPGCGCTGLPTPRHSPPAPQ